MDQQELEQDLRFFMNAMSAHNLILRALLRANPGVSNQLNAFLSQAEPQNEDQDVVYEEVRKLVSRS